MNLLKRISIVLSATLFLWGCSDSDEPVNEMNDSLSLSTNEIKINGLGGEVAVTVTSSDDWRLAGTYDWAHPSATSGKVETKLHSPLIPTRWMKSALQLSNSSLVLQ